MLESEVLARALFRSSARGEQGQNLTSVHPDAEIAPSFDPRRTLTAGDLRAHLEAQDGRRLLDAHGQTYMALDDERVIVEGQVRLLTDEGVEYRPTVWALVFRDGLLYRSWAVGTVQEAGALLAADVSGARVAVAGS